MADAKRTILFLSSDPNNEGRDHWDREHRGIGESIERGKNRDLLSFKEKWAVRVMDLRRALLDENPNILHFASGKQGDGIVVETTQGTRATIEPQALGGLLQLFADQIQCVVLSGCFTPLQAEVISQEIGWVLGLEGDLSPEDRMEICTSFYDSLAAGKDEAFAGKIAKATAGMNGCDSGKVHIYYQGMPYTKDPEVETEIDGEKDLIPDDESDLEDLTHMGNSSIYLCNRSEQTQHFSQTLDTGNATEKIFFYGLHGEEKQSHSGLFQRFYYDYLFDPDRSTESTQREIVLHEANDQGKYQSEVKESLLTAFGQGRLMRMPEREQLSRLAEYFDKRGVQTVAISFRVRSSHWKPFTPDLIRWFVDDYCCVKNINPNFYIFLSVIYESKVKAAHFMRLDEIKAQIPQLHRCVILEELKPVSLKDIDLWIEQHITTRRSDREKLIKRYFSDSNKRTFYDMEEVEKRLYNLLNDNSKARKDKPLTPNS